ncbi:hypothetical protein QBC39DRAFT_432728 [Podospora conica]|nr:hypothetical protein QBC39DRAFT_432728 [Schizothecium conicum]
MASHQAANQQNEAGAHGGDPNCRNRLVKAIKFPNEVVECPCARCWERARTLYLTNFLSEVPDSDVISAIRSLFSRHGKVDSVFFVERNGQRVRPKAMFVRFAASASAWEAKNHLNRSKLQRISNSLSVTFVHGSVFLGDQWKNGQRQLPKELPKEAKTNQQHPPFPWPQPIQNRGFGSPAGAPAARHLAHPNIQGVKAPMGRGGHRPMMGNKNAGNQSPEHVIGRSPSDPFLSTEPTVPPTAANPNSWLRPIPPIKSTGRGQRATMPPAPRAAPAMGQQAMGRQSFAPTYFLPLVPVVPAFYAQSQSFADPGAQAPFPTTHAQHPGWYFFPPVPAAFPAARGPVDPPSVPVAPAAPAPVNVPSRPISISQEKMLDNTMVEEVVLESGHTYVFSDGKLISRESPAPSWMRSRKPPPTPTPNREPPRPLVVNGSYGGIHHQLALATAGRMPLTAFRSFRDLVPEGSVPISVLGAQGSTMPVITQGVVPMPAHAHDPVRKSVRTQGTVPMPVITEGSVSKPVIADGSFTKPVIVNGSFTKPVPARSSVPKPVVADGSFLMPSIDEGMGSLIPEGSVPKSVIAEGKKKAAPLPVTSSPSPTSSVPASVDNSETSIPVAIQSPSAVRSVSAREVSPPVATKSSSPPSASATAQYLSSPGSVDEQFGETVVRHPSRAQFTRLPSEWTSPAAPATLDTSAPITMGPTSASVPEVSPLSVTESPASSSASEMAYTFSPPGSVIEPASETVVRHPSRAQATRLPSEWTSTSVPGMPEVDAPIDTSSSAALGSPSLPPLPEGQLYAPGPTAVHNWHWSANFGPCGFGASPVGPPPAASSIEIHQGFYGVVEPPSHGASPPQPSSSNADAGAAVRKAKKKPIPARPPPAASSIEIHHGFFEFPPFSSGLSTAPPSSADVSDHPSPVEGKPKKKAKNKKKKKAKRDDDDDDDARDSSPASHAVVKLKPGRQRARGAQALQDLFVAPPAGEASRGAESAGGAESSIHGCFKGLPHSFDPWPRSSAEESAA